MITLTGVGGVGKTLLASELARCATERYEHGAFMVDLAPLGEDDDIAGAICAVLGVQPQGDRPVPDALNDWLQGRSILLFFDNAEHLTDRLGPLIQTLLERCAEVTALVTSRSPVGIAAETLRTVPPLSAGDGVELFRQRAATAGRMDALLTDPQACEELCRRVDGLPLAIEVVAARTRTMTPSELLRRLDHRLASAALPESGRVDRHRTLRATVDWSYRLLDHDEQVLFARLSTFSGSFDLEAVERVCAFGMLDVDSVVDLVDGLVASPSSRSTGRVQRPASGCSRCFASTPTNSSSRSIERRPEPVIVACTPRSPSGRIVSFAVRTQERATRSFSSSGTTCAAPTLAPWPRVTARQPSGSRCTPGDTPSTTCESNTPSGSIGSWPPSHTQRAQRRHGGWPPIGTRTSPAMRSRPNVSRC